LSQGATGLDLARRLLAGKNGLGANGKAKSETTPVRASERGPDER
jgi:hypothetical protein